LTDLVLFFESIDSLLVSNLTKLMSKECIRSFRSFREMSIYLARIVMPCRRLRYVVILNFRHILLRLVGKKLLQNSFSCSRIVS